MKDLTCLSDSKKIQLGQHKILPLPTSGTENGKQQELEPEQDRNQPPERGPYDITMCELMARTLSLPQLYPFFRDSCPKRIRARQTSEGWGIRDEGSGLGVAKKGFTRLPRYTNKGFCLGCHIDCRRAQKDEVISYPTNPHSTTKKIKGVAGVGPSNPFCLGPRLPGSLLKNGRVCLCRVAGKRFRSGPRKSVN